MPRFAPELCVTIVVGTEPPCSACCERESRRKRQQKYNAFREVNSPDVHAPA